MSKKIVKFHEGQLIEYEIYKLVDFYDPILRLPTAHVKLETIEDKRKADYIANSLAETLAKSQGLGLSANQCGISQRMFSIAMGEQIWTLINPEIVEKSESFAEYSEGCLSYPGLYLKLKRSDRIKVKFQFINGQWTEQEFDGLTAVCIQHEIDHLDGKVFTDMVSPIKLEQAKKKIKQNLKRWKKYLAEQETYLENLKKAQEQNKKAHLLQSIQEPQIKILENSGDVTIQQPKKVEKFVYNLV